jgi:hypothetical protein
MIGYRGSIEKEQSFLPRVVERKDKEIESRKLKQNEQ